MAKNILKVEGTFFLPIKEGETLAEAYARFDRLVLQSDEVETATFAVSVIDENGDTVKTLEGESII